MVALPKDTKASSSHPKATKVSNPLSQPTKPPLNHLHLSPPHQPLSQLSTRLSRTLWRVSGRNVSKAQLLPIPKFDASWRMSA